VLPARLDEGVHTVVDVLVRVGRGNLDADPGFALWHDGEGEPDHVDACGGRESMLKKTLITFALKMRKVMF